MAFTFIALTGFDQPETRAMLDMLDSLVRVSRRVGRSRMVVSILDA